MKQITGLSLLLWIPFCLSAQSTDFMRSLNDYIENLDVFEQGQEAGRAFHIPGSSLSMNGNWQFYYSDTPAGIPDRFYESTYDASRWDAIAVPANWEMQGYGDKLFRNISTTYAIERPATAPPDPYAAFRPAAPSLPFAVAPPLVPDEYNPTGAYRRSFTLPDDWQGQQVFLRFEKVASASFVWVNGQEVGYNEGAQEPAEYNITPYLQPGENSIAVLVLKFSDGYYLEGQDYWRLAGIFDDVWLYATPAARLFDWQVLTDLDAHFVDADLSVKVDVKNYGAALAAHQVRASLKQHGQTVAVMESRPAALPAAARQTFQVSSHISQPDQWTAETPHLYDLELELLNAEGQLVDHLSTKIGFKETEIRGNTFYLNGRPIKVNAMNSHMQHPETGHAMDEATIRRDFELLKQFNFNAVRTSHYPPVNQYLALANEYGLYVIDEAGTEAHASEYLSDMPEYIPMYQERVRKMVLRDRNYPCILFWSAGNESGEGDNIREVIEAGKSLDPSRSWMYGGNADRHPAEEIIGPRYPTAIELDINFGKVPDAKRPSFLDEYLAVTGNGGGGLDEYWRVINNHPRIMGGAIWDFVSPGLLEPVRQVADQSPFGTPAHLMGNGALVEGPNSQVLDLNGHDQWVEVYRADNLAIEGDALSLYLEVYPRALMQSSGPLLNKGSNQFGLEQQGADSLVFYMYTDQKHTLRARLPDNWMHHWHQVLATYDGAMMRLYLDGQELANRPASGSITNFPFPVNIGRNVETHDQDNDVYLCDAQLDNVAIFTKVATPQTPLRAADAVFWLDFEEETQAGHFYSYGIGARTYGAIWPDRRPQPEMWQMKKSVQPLSFRLLDPESLLLEVENRSDFTAADHWVTTWRLMEDDRVLQSGRLDLDGAPRTKMQLRLPCTRPTIVPGREYRIDISTQLLQDELWAAEGFEVAWEQLELSHWNIPAPVVPAAEQALQLKEEESAYLVMGADFTYRFDKTTGALTAIQLEGAEVLAAPLQLNTWRAPLANELDPWNGITFRTNRWKEGYGTTIATDYYSNGIDAIQSELLSMTVTQNNGRVYIQVRDFALMNDGRKQYSLRDRYISGLTLSGFENNYTYVIAGDGTITLDHQVQPRGNMPQMLPRIGLTTRLQQDFDQVVWYGRGPQENYPDRKTGYRVGVYQSTVADLYEPYLIPQDHGLRTDNRWLKVTNRAGRGLAIAMDTHFNFNAYPYTTDNLTRALYPFQLKAPGDITLNLDYATTGVGGTARLVLNPYRVHPQAYHRKVVIRPLR